MYTSRFLQQNVAIETIPMALTYNKGMVCWRLPGPALIIQHILAVKDIPVLSLEYEYRAYLALGRLEQAGMLSTWLQGIKMRIGDVRMNEQMILIAKPVGL
jgi:hypothetical protein